MLKDVWDSFKENIKERVTNPFLGTFALVWIVHNWRVVFAFFNFDKEWKLQNKIDYFNKYWTEHNFIWNLVAVAFITVATLIITYSFLALSRFLANYFENIVIPWIYKLSKGKTVIYETYQKVTNRISELEGRVEEERKLKIEAIGERDRIEGNYSKLFEEKGSFEKTREEVRIEQEKLIQAKDEFRTEYDQFSREKNEYIRDKAKFEGSLNYSNERSKNDLAKLLEIISQSLDVSEFERTILKILKGDFLTSNNSIDFLLKSGLVNVKSKSTSGTISYLLTEEGEEFRRFYFRNKL
jgi:hypothetical protein